jgi:hypothetical protein
MALSRRQTLKNISAGLGGAAVAPSLLPFVQQAQAEAAGDAALLPKRVVFVVKASGLTPNALVPKEIAEERIERRPGSKPSDNYQLPDKLKPAEKLINQSLANKTLPASLQSLEPFKDQMTILQGLSGKMCKGGHSSWYGCKRRSKSVAPVGTKVWRGVDCIAGLDVGPALWVCPIGLS